MKTKLILIIIFFVPFIIKAQESSLLYKITGPGVDNPSYIYGTIHMMCPDQFDMSEPIKEAFSNTETLVMELDMDDPAMMPEMQKFSVNPGMKNISDQFSQVQLDSLNAVLKRSYGATMAQFGVMKPFVIMSMLMPSLLDCAQVASYEQEFLKMAKEKEMPVEGLESVEFQMALFDAIPAEDQIEWIDDMLMNREKSVEDFDKMVARYQEHDLEGLFELIIENPQYESHMESLLYNRNAKWVPMIIEKIKAEPTFFAVGAGHLASDKGVLALLKKEGYTVEPVKL